MLNIFAAFADVERELIRERTLSGLRSARARGRVGGAKLTLAPTQVKLAQTAMKDRITVVNDLCEQLAISPVTLYRYVSPTADPGIGLRNSPRRVLTYADLFNLNDMPDPRDPTREIQLHLTGNMARYMWSFDGVKFDDAEPIKLKYGERVRFTLVNDTMLTHTIHLHGLWSDLETDDVKRIPRKHTVTVQPGSQVGYLVTADAQGNLAYHCHLLMHMAVGMIRNVQIT